MRLFRYLMQIRKTKKHKHLLFPFVHSFVFNEGTFYSTRMLENCEREEPERGAITIYVTSIFLEYS
jgi:hypothetical protein